MITIHESHFFLIIILTSIITYILFSVFQSCDISCKVNYYKYENHHEQKKISNKPPIQDYYGIDNDLFNEYNLKNEVTIIGDKNSSHNQSLQGNDINFTDSDAYINKLLNLN